MSAFETEAGQHIGELSPWRTRRLWSLRDMMQHYIGGLYYCLGRSAIIRGQLETPFLVADAGQLAELRKNAIEVTGHLKTRCSDLGLVEAIRYIDRMFIAETTPADRVAWILESINKVVENEADQRLCYTIDKKKSDLYDAELKHWVVIQKKFEAASKEGVSALVCYAVDQDTACVFHLMRVAEIGLRALAKERRVNIPKKPLAWAEWQEILTHLGRKVDEIGKRKRGPTKDAALAFYQGALGEFGAFKDTYRNVVMHVRKTYDEHEAASALLHVREFMHRLSARLGENDTKAIKWGKF